MVKPFLKWVGGKTQIMDKLLTHFPQKINNYHEIFLGGGSVLLNILQSKIIITGQVYAYDLNEPLVYVYKNIQTNYFFLFLEIQLLINDFNNCGNGIINRNPKNYQESLENKENYYYFIREEYNKLSDKNSLTGSAMFIFLNKTCFRGIFRIGPNGFNVPYGHNKNPEIITKQHLEEIHHLIKNVHFKCCSFENSLKEEYKLDDFIYLDPPYVPEQKTSFVGYTKDGFTEHTKLFNIVINLHCLWTMNNSDTQYVKEYFKNYNITTLLCKRAINSKNPNSTINEVIIKNNV